MSFKNCDFKVAYETSENKNSLVDEFYIPFLSNSVRYCRIAGYFSSTSLSIASQGIAALIDNGGVMKLLISPELTNADFEIIKNGQDLDEKSDLFKDFDINENSDDHLKALAWMLYNNKLEIKIVVDLNKQNAIFHQKVGVGFDSENNIVSFSGSVNESAQAWLYNIEEFKVFKSWVIGQQEFINADINKFNKYWNDEKKSLAKVFDLPTAINEKIISIKPDNIFDLGLMKKYIRKKNGEKTFYDTLFAHQKRAVDLWPTYNHKFLVMFATGTGKTRTAYGCMNDINNQNGILYIVATPQSSLCVQWEIDMKKIKLDFGKSHLIPEGISNWKKVLKKMLISMNIGLSDKNIIFTTHATASSQEFINIIKENKGKIKICFICDEVHSIGSFKQRNALLEEYEYRIGLSATPTRMFDDEGTELIKDYFGRESVEFTIGDALKTINPITGDYFLNHYLYKPRFVDLTEQEMKEYKRLTSNIRREENEEIPDENKINTLRILRSKILKKAENKVVEFENVINELNKNGEIRDLIVFVNEETQIKSVFNVLNSYNILCAKITEDELTPERTNIINNFSKGIIKVLVAVNCLNEGIDIPSAKTAILIASSTNNREYVQRIGRVIRYMKNKGKSEIYDMIVKPEGFSATDYNIFIKECSRVQAIAQYADNYDDVKILFRRMGVDLK